LARTGDHLETFFVELLSVSEADEDQRPNVLKPIRAPVVVTREGQIKVVEKISPFSEINGTGNLST
jgi:hypothetical protein